MALFLFIVAVAVVAWALGYDIGKMVERARNAERIHALRSREVDYSWRVPDVVPYDWDQEAR